LPALIRVHINSGTCVIRLQMSVLPLQIGSPSGAFMDARENVLGP